MASKRPPENLSASARKADDETRLLRFTLGIFTILIVAFLLAPILVIISASLTASNFLVFPPQGLSFKWFQAAVENRKFVDGMKVSVVLALLTALISTTLGTLSALAIARYRFRGREAIATFLLSPLMIPTVVLGVASLQFLVIFGLVGTAYGLLIGHVLVALPYAVRLIAVSLGGFNWDLHRAAIGLGASQFYALRHVVLPLVKPGLVGAATFSFILSFDEVTISLFTSGPRISTLPVEIFRWAEFSFDPIIAAASAIMVGIVAIGVVIIQSTIGIETVFGQEKIDD